MEEAATEEGVEAIMKEEAVAIEAEEEQTTITEMTVAIVRTIGPGEVEEISIQETITITEIRLDLAGEADMKAKNTVTSCKIQMIQTFTANRRSQNRKRMMVSSINPRREEAMNTVEEEAEMIEEATTEAIQIEGDMIEVAMTEDLKLVERLKEQKQARISVMLI